MQQLLKNIIVPNSHKLEKKIQMPINRMTTNEMPCNGTPLQYSCLENPMDGGA